MTFASFSFFHKINEEVEIDFDEDIDGAKPVPGRTEIMVYDRKSMNMVKKSIKFDKAKHKYLSFCPLCLIQEESL